MHSLRDEKAFRPDVRLIGPHSIERLHASSEQRFVGGILTIVQRNAVAIQMLIGFVLCLVSR